MTTVLLTGSRAPATLDLARRFADDGVRVVVADSQPAITSSSSAVEAAYRVPSPRFRPREFAAAVAGIAARHAADLIVPTCEETFWLAAAAAAPAAAASAVAGAASPAAAAVAASIAAPVLSSVLAPTAGRQAAVPLGQLLFAPPIEVLRRLHDKAEFAALLSELDLPHPATEVVDSAIDWRHRAQARERALDRGGTHAPARLVLKPAFSRFGTRTRVIEPHQPLPDLPRVTRHERWVLQEHVEGTEFCTYAVAIEGRLTAFVAYRPVWRAGRRGDTGAGVAFERLDPATAPVREARRIAARLAAALTLTGQFGLDLMHRPPRPGDAGAGAGARAGADAEARIVVLECNPRATSGIHLFASSDHLARAFLPHLARRPASPAVPSHEPEPEPEDEHGPESEHEATAAPGAPPIQASRATARLGLPHAMYPPLGPPVARALTFTRQLRYPDALRPPEDRLPLAALVRSLAVQLRESRRARVGLLAASTYDLEWNGEPLPPEPSPADPGAEPMRPADANRSTPDDGWAGALAAAVAEAGGVAATVTTATAELRTVRVGDHELPLTVSTHRQRSTHRRSSTGHRGSTGRQGSTHRQPDDLPAQGTEQTDASPPSYVVSPFTHYVDYAREELGELTSASARRAAGLLLRGLGAILDAGRVDDIVLVGNGLVSTNLLPDAGERAVAEVTARLRREHPQRAIGWRSVHGRGMLLPETLRRSGYRLLPSRSVFFAPTRGDEWLGLRDVRRDRQLFEASGYEAVPAPIDPRTGASDLATRERIVELYRLLYLDKYSRLNPAYTPAFIAAAQRSGFLDFTLLVRRDAPVTTPGPDTTAGTGTGRIDGVMGTRTAHGFLAAPVFGYDTSLPPETGLYRMLSWLVARRAHDEGAELHASSGVADFKRHRGGEAELEYTAVYVRHLPWRRRLAWGVLETVLTRVAVPLLDREGL